jgi:formate-dependent nitrite reductase membrane component NrfD
MNIVQGIGEARFSVDFRAQQHWDWQVAFYLYGGGTSAGLVFLAVALRGIGLVDEGTALGAMWISLVLALVSLALLFNHLGPESRWVFFNVYRRLRNNWTARGATTITALVLLEILMLLPSVRGFEGLPWVEGTISGMVLRGAILLFALAFTAYTGLVLSSWNSIAFWNTPALPILYMGYSFLGGMAALLLAEPLTGSGTVSGIGPVLWPYLLALLVGNAFILVMYVWAASTGTLPARESVRRLLHGEHRGSFLGGTVGIGLVFPALVVALAVSGQLGTGTAAMSVLAVAYAAIQVGGFLLRDNILRVGIFGYPV